MTEDGMADMTLNISFMNQKRHALLQNLFKQLYQRRKIILQKHWQRQNQGFRLFGHTRCSLSQTTIPAYLNVFNASFLFAIKHSHSI